MKRWTFALVYTALAALAIPAMADVEAAQALRSGDMKKLNFHSSPEVVPNAQFMTFEGAPLTLETYRGKWTLVNFWATWCAPCRKEMPMLSELQTDLGGDHFEVVTIATGRNVPQGMVKFFDDIGVDNLPLHRDPKQVLARQMAVLGLPITVILDPEGREIARLRGDADWSSDTAKAILQTLIGAPADT
ncbi:MAG: TlpA family protein disulfide reductase [Paracoccaceae bacterium]